MPPSTTFDEPPEFDVGDRVVSVDRVGSLRRGIARGSPGTVIARTADRLIAVRFDSGRVEHVSLARWADLVLVAPATADSMARAAIGLGDDLLSATILAGARDVLWAPAMNPEMWSNPATARNVETLKSWGHRFVGPAEGLMASAEEEPGVGRLADEADIVAAAETVLSEVRR